MFCVIDKKKSGKPIGKERDEQEGLLPLGMDLPNFDPQK